MPDYVSFRNLKVWQRSMSLVEEIYRVSHRFPRDEQFGLTSQIRRASVSIPSNIGEGKRRKRERAFLNHLDIALGSQGEVEVQLEIAKRIGFLSTIRLRAGSSNRRGGWPDAEWFDRVDAAARVNPGYQLSASGYRLPATGYQLADSSRIQIFR